jgi:DNA polymerase delta subunit 1
MNAKFKNPIQLLFEKVFNPYLLMAKKRYAGVYWENDVKPKEGISAKGIESVRRDNCQLTSKTVERCIEILMIDRDKQKAIDYVKNLLSDLLQNKIDLALLVISKGYTKSAEEYAGKQAHVELVKRISQRTPDKAPSIGDRVPFVIVAGNKKSKAFEKAEDPMYVLENNLPVVSSKLKLYYSLVCRSISIITSTTS